MQIFRTSRSTVQPRAMLLPALIALLATAPVGGCLRGDAEETIAASRFASGVQPVQHAKGTSSSPSLAQA